MRAILLFLLLSCAPAAEERRVVAAPRATASTSGAPTPGEVPEPLATGAVPPSPIGRTPIVRRLDSNAWQTCVVRANGTVMCWGAGGLVAPAATGGLVAPVRPVVIGNLTDAVEIATSARQSCARKKGGTVACWGVSGGAFALARDTATVLPGITGVSHIFAGAGHDLALVAGDSLVTVAADGKMHLEKLPVAGSDIIDLSGARAHACLVAKDGAVWCWGSNSLGAVGGEGKFVRVPTIDDAIAVSAADSFTCAVRASGYRACWGNGHHLYGGYGNGSYPVVTDKRHNDAFRVAAGRTSCWLQRDKQVLCDGEGRFGQLGNGNAGYGSSLVRGLADAVELSIGFEHECALRADDDVVCWGANDRGQLGDGTLIDRTIPVGVLGLGGKEPPAPAKPGSGPPIAIAATAGPTAAWREADTGYMSTIDRRWTGFASHTNTPSTFGSKAAFFAHEGGLAFHLDHGIVGPIATPKDTKQVFLDGDDALWVATKDSLLRAANVVEAKQGKLQKVLAIPYAVDFAVTTGLAVAADATTLHITRDAGKTFTKVKPKADLTIDDVLARSDGLIAVVGSDKAGEPSVLLAKDGAAFVPSLFQPSKLYQVGTHIYANGCPGAILSSDGKTWNSWDNEHGAPLTSDAWGHALRISSTPHAFFAEGLKTLADPPAPPPEKESAKGKPGACPSAGGLGGVGMGGLGGLRRGGACAGVSCVRATIGDEPRATINEVGFYSDGACDRDSKKACTKPWKRQPHVWMTLAKGPVDLPTACDPIRILTAGGIGVLFCAKDEKTQTLYTISKDGVFRSEGTVPAIESDALTIASDGTLLVHPVCGDRGQGTSGACPAALVRAPLPLGAANAWRATTALNAYGYRVLGAGTVLLITGDSELKVSFALDRAGKTTPWGPAVTLTADLLDVTVLKDRVLLLQQMTSRKPFRSYVAANGLVLQE